MALKGKSGPSIPLCARPSMPSSTSISITKEDARLTLLKHGKLDEVIIQGSAKEWSLGCVKRAPAARGGQDAGITQPRDHSLADPCNLITPSYPLKEDIL